MEFKLLPFMRPLKLEGTIAQIFYSKCHIFFWRLCVIPCLFDNKKHVREDFLRNPSLLERRFLIGGFFMLLIYPFMLVHLFLFFFLRYFKDVHQNSSIFLRRRFSHNAECIYRCYGELPYQLQARLNQVKHLEAAQIYSNFGKYALGSSFLRSIRYITAALSGLLLFIGIFNETILVEFEFYNRNLLWYGILFGTISVSSRNAADTPTLENSKITDKRILKANWWRTKFEETGIANFAQIEETALVLLSGSFYLPRNFRSSTMTEAQLFYDWKKSSQVFSQSFFPSVAFSLVSEFAGLFITPWILLMNATTQAHTVAAVVERFHFTTGLGDFDGHSPICAISSYFPSERLSAFHLTQFSNADSCEEFVTKFREIACPLSIDVSKGVISTAYMMLQYGDESQFGSISEIIQLSRDLGIDSEAAKFLETTNHCGRLWEQKVKKNEKWNLFNSMLWASLLLLP
eukprot:GHVP01005125.1.p1 GENE.GHVP01005125.1~~GHVP01005125.1.p1  ORF type:complete len:460 (+),score=60.49 GHVP01005125.1:1638-3017(+)